MGAGRPARLLPQGAWRVNRRPTTRSSTSEGSRFRWLDWRPTCATSRSLAPSERPATGALRGSGAIVPVRASALSAALSAAEETEIVARVRAGGRARREAAGDLFRRLREPVHAVCLHVTGRRADAEARRGRRPSAPFDRGLPGFARISPDSPPGCTGSRLRASFRAHSRARRRTHVRRRGAGLPARRAARWCSRSSPWTGCRIARSPTSSASPRDRLDAPAGGEEDACGGASRWAPTWLYGGRFGLRQENVPATPGGNHESGLNRTPLRPLVRRRGRRCRRARPQER